MVKRKRPKRAEIIAKPRARIVEALNVQIARHPEARGHWTATVTVSGRGYAATYKGRPAEADVIADFAGCNRRHFKRS